jgi:glycosyltransferase involved in cell wall biosynthesis
LPELSKQLVVITNGIELNRYKPRDRPRLGNGDRVIVISVGRIAPLKNYATAIRAMSQLRDRNFEYWIAGDGPESQVRALETLIDEMQLRGKVKLLGFQGDMLSLLGKADVFLLTSLWEGFGLAVVEAMAAGLPVVVSDVPGVREVVGIETGAGFMVAPRDEAAIAERVGILISDGDLRSAMGAHARKRAATFGIEETVRGYERLYQDVLQRHLTAE